MVGPRRGAGCWPSSWGKRFAISFAHHRRCVRCPEDRDKESKKTATTPELRQEPQANNVNASCGVMTFHPVRLLEVAIPATGRETDTKGGVKPRKRCLVRCGIYVVWEELR